MKFLFAFLFLCFSVGVVAADSISIYPANWWVGMKNPRLQLMLHGKNIATVIKAVTINYAGVKLERINRGENPNDLFIDLQIAAATKSGKFSINTHSAYGELNYQLASRSVNN